MKKTGTYIGLVFMLCFYCVKAQTVSQYLKTWENKTLSDSVRFFALDEATWYYAFSKPDSGYLLAGQQLAFLKQKNIGRIEWVGRAYNNLAWSCANAGNYSLAIENELRLKDLSEKAGYLKGVATAQGNLGQFYQLIRQYKKALEFQLLAIQTNQKLGDESGLARAYNNIALVYDVLQQHALALNYLKLSMAIKQKQKDQLSIIILYNNFANQYAQLKKLDSAVYFANVALDMTDKFPNDIQRTLAVVNLADYYIKLGQYKKGYTYAQMGLDLSLKTGNQSNQMYALLSMANALDAMGRHREAVMYYKQHMALKDSVFDEEAESNALKSAMKYEMRKKLEADSLQNVHEKELNAITLNRQKIYTYSALAGFALLLVIAFISFRAYRQKKKDNLYIAEQKQLVEEKQAEIVDSINYARHIQHAILATPGEIKKYFPQSFLLYRPKDIVAGDFYFFETTATHVFYAAADCTGHGVPGALVSVVCSNALARCVREFGLTAPGAILDRARLLVIETFEKSGQEVKDGMDISLVSIGKTDLNQLNEPGKPGTSTLRISWAGANNPLWIIKNHSNEITVIKPDKQPIGKFAQAKPFTTHTLTLQTGDTFYLFTDGYADQFGGPSGKKFKYSALQQLLLELKDFSPAEQEKILDDRLEEWKAGFEQTDDVCIMGVRVGAHQ